MATRLEVLRRLKGASRYRVSQDTGIPYNTLKRIEQGENESIRRDHIRRLAEYYGSELTVGVLVESA